MFLCTCCLPWKRDLASFFHLYLIARLWSGSVGRRPGGVILTSYVLSMEFPTSVFHLSFLESSATTFFKIVHLSANSFSVTSFIPRERSDFTFFLLLFHRKSLSRSASPNDPSAQNTPPSTIRFNLCSHTLLVIWPGLSSSVAKVSVNGLYISFSARNCLPVSRSHFEYLL